MMQRGSNIDHSGSGGLGPQLVGEKIHVNSRVVSVIRQLGEGGFSFVYLVKDISDDEHHHNNNNSSSTNNNHHSSLSSSSIHKSNSNNHNHDNDLTNLNINNNANNTNLNNNPNNDQIVLKITSIHSRQQRDIAEKEANLLSKLSHPSIVRMIDSCYRHYPIHITHHNHTHHNHHNFLFDKDNSNRSLSSSINNHSHNNSNNNNHNNNNSSSTSSSTNNHTNIRHQHLILMEFCEGGTALSVCNNLKSSNKRFDLHSLIIAFGQICNAVSYLHAQRPPIVHRDLKPVNFLVKNGAYKLCDFGSAVFGHVDLRTSRARSEAEEVIQKTTTQMFRSPEMVDLYMSKKLTQSTDVWALGCCLYSLAFLQNCFEEGSNLAILSCNYKIPEDNPYGKDLVELIDRMLTVNCKERADMTEVILCLSAIYSGRPLPPRKRGSKSDKGGDENYRERKGKTEERVGTFRTDGQGIRKSILEETRPVEAKKLNPNSAAARRRRAVEEGGGFATIPLTRQRSSRIGKPKMNTKQTSHEPFYGDSSGFGLSNASTFSQIEDPFHIGEERVQKSRLSFFSSKDSGTDASSQDWGGDFSSENGSGFDNFGSSDDGSRSTGFGTSAAPFLKTLGNPKDIIASVPPFSPDNLRFTNFGAEDNQNDFLSEEGFEATYDGGDIDANTRILAKINEVGKSDDSQKNRKKGFKSFFGKS